jgi:hypothetical protein
MQKIEHFDNQEKVYKEKESKVIEHATGKVDPPCSADAISSNSYQETKCSCPEGKTLQVGQVSGFFSNTDTYWCVPDNQITNKR